MPHIGSETVDPQAVDAVHAWIRQLPIRSEEAAKLRELRSLVDDRPLPDDPDDRRREEKRRGERTRRRGELIGELLATTSRALYLARAMDEDPLPAPLRDEVLAAAHGRETPSIRDLFEPLQPPEFRVKRLGAAVKPDQILRLAGDAERGRKLFFETAGVQCKNCHRIDGTGSLLGPDLSQIGRKYAPAIARTDPRTVQGDRTEVRELRGGARRRASDHRIAGRPDGRRTGGARRQGSAGPSGGIRGGSHDSATPIANAGSAAPRPHRGTGGRPPGFLGRTSITLGHRLRHPACCRLLLAEREGYGLPSSLLVPDVASVILVRRLTLGMGSGVLWRSASVMKVRMLTGVAVGLTLLIGAAGVAYQAVRPGPAMTAAAQQWLATLSGEQRSKAVMDYDAPQRLDWHFIPKASRKGLQIREMNDARQAARALLRASLSEIGYGKATRIMEYEALLKELEKAKTNTPLRDTERYYFTVFGQPSESGRWGLSIEGHHMSFNFVIDKGRVVSSSPNMFGANPATIKNEALPGFKIGDRLLAKEEQLAFDLLASLDADQRKTAVIAEKAFDEVRTAGGAATADRRRRGTTRRETQRRAEEDPAFARGGIRREYAGRSGGRPARVA